MPARQTKGFMQVSAYRIFNVPKFPLVHKFSAMEVFVPIFDNIPSILVIRVTLSFMLLNSGNF